MLPLHLTNVDINDRKISARISIRGLLVLLSYMPSLYNRLQQQLETKASSRAGQCIPAGSNVSLVENVEKNSVQIDALATLSILKLIRN